jgi:hypothetical protein
MCRAGKNHIFYNKIIKNKLFFVKKKPLKNLFKKNYSDFFLYLFFLYILVIKEYLRLTKA